MFQFESIMFARTARTLTCRSIHKHRMFFRRQSLDCYALKKGVVPALQETTRYLVFNRASPSSLMLTRLLLPL